MSDLSAHIHKLQLYVSFCFSSDLLEKVLCSCDKQINRECFMGGSWMCVRWSGGRWSSVSNWNQNSLWKYLTGSIAAQTKASSRFNETITTFWCLNKSQRLFSSAVHKYLAVRLDWGSLAAHVCSTKTLAAVLWLLWSTGLWSKLRLWRVLHWTDSGAGGAERRVYVCVVQLYICVLHSQCVWLYLCSSEMRRRPWITHTQCKLRRELK